MNDMVILKRASGALLPKPQGNQAEGKLARFIGWLRERLAVNGDLTLDEIVVEMPAVHGVTGHGVTVHGVTGHRVTGHGVTGHRVTVHGVTVGRWLHRLGLSHKKNAARKRNPAARGGGAAQGLGRGPPV